MKIIVAVIITFLLSSVLCNAEPISQCCKDIEDIKINFKVSYKNNKKFWDTLYCVSSEAVKGDKYAVSQIISLYGIGTHNSEFTEWFAGTIKLIYLQVPIDLLDKLTELDEKTVNGIVYYLKNPIDGEKDDIIKVSKRVDVFERYPNLVRSIIGDTP